MRVDVYLIVTVLLCLAGSSLGQQCVPLRDNETTRKGYFATVVFSEKGPRKSVRGTVVLNFGDTPQQDVFVEVFYFRRKSKEYKRSAACRTKATGEFAFDRLRAGDYKIVLSKDGGFQITEILLKVDPKSKNREPIFASIEPGY